MAEPNLEPDFLGTKNQEKASWAPWIVAALVVVLGIGVWAIVGHRTEPPAQNVGTGLTSADPYSSSLTISDLQMSEADSFAGGKVTYIDGKITNTGQKTLNAITVQVGFKNDLGEYGQRIAVPLSLIRTREPYVDTQPVSASPLQPNQQRDFRLIFDTVPPDWNMQYPDLRVISVRIQ